MFADRPPFLPQFYACEMVLEEEGIFGGERRRAGAMRGQRTQKEQWSFPLPSPPAPAQPVGPAGGACLRMGAGCWGGGAQACPAKSPAALAFPPRLPQEKLCPPSPECSAWPRPSLQHVLQWSLPYSFPHPDLT